MKIKRKILTSLSLVLLINSMGYGAFADEISIPRANYVTNKHIKNKPENKNGDNVKKEEVSIDLKEEERYAALFKEHFFNSNYKYENNQGIPIKNIDNLFILRDYEKPFSIDYKNIKKTFKVDSPWLELENIDTEIKSITNNGTVKLINEDTIQINYPQNLKLIIKGIKNLNVKNGDTINKGDVIGKSNNNVYIELSYKDQQMSPLFLFVDNLFPRGGMGIPLMRQTDPIWKNYRYGDTTNLIAGCGPTSLSMVISYLKGEYITPANMISHVGGTNSKYMISGQGSLWSMMTEVPKEYGLKSKVIKTQKELEDSLNNNNPVIAIMGVGYFTDAGHYIVIRGIDKDGYLLVNDPADMSSKNNYKKSFLASKVIKESKCMWSISK